MAKTVDELVLKTSVEGASSLDQVNAKLASIDESAKKTATAMNQVQGGVRNVAYQVQDLAVQLSMGTNVFMALGQQLPQLLSGFGTMGVVIGAVAAVAIPALQAGLKAAGIDFRNLKEMTDDLAKSNDVYIAAQKQNQTTLAGLGNSYGIVTDEAKNFFEVQEKLTRSKATRDNIDAVKELKDEYSKLSEETAKTIRDQARFTPMGGAGAAEAGMWFRQFRKGLTEEQGYAVSKMLKDIDGASPEKTVAAINNVLTYLSDIGPEADKFKQSFEKSVEPLMKINAELIKTQTNIRDAAQQASAFQTDLVGIQNQYQPDINAAKRNFSQITAFGLEGKMRLAEFDRQMAEKNKDGIDRTKEAEAGRLRIQQETNDKIKDYVKGQSEAFKSIVLTNDGKVRQLELEKTITDIQDKGRLGFAYDVQYQQDIAKNAVDYANSVAGIQEQRRKGVITADAEKKLIKETAEIQRLADENAAQARDKRKADLDFQNQQARESMKIGLESKERVLQASLDLEKQWIGLTTVDVEKRKTINSLDEERRQKEAEIRNNVLLGSEEQNKRLEILTKSYEKQKELAIATIEYQNSFEAGWAKAFANYMDNATNAAKVAGNMFNAMTSNLNSAIDNFVENGKFSFSDLTNSILKDLIKIQMKAAAANMLSIGGNFLGGLFGLSGKALGGPVDAGRPYMIGERGPEAFIPATAGTIIPNDKLFSGGGASASYVTYNISAVDAMSFKQMLAQDPTFLHAVAEQGRKSLPMTRR